MNCVTWPLHYNYPYFSKNCTLGNKLNMSLKSTSLVFVFFLLFVWNNKKPEVATVIQTAVSEVSSKMAWDCEGQLRDNTLGSGSLGHNLLCLALDAIWIFIVAVRAGTGPPSNLAGSISSSGSTITRRSWTGTPSGRAQSPSLSSVRTPCLDRWLLSQDERLMAWCTAITEG